MQKGGAVAGTGPIGRRFNQNRAAFWIGFYSLILMAWTGLFWLTTPPLPGLSALEFWQSLCLGASGAPFSVLVGMWAVMSAAMMLPSFVPTVRVFEEVCSIGATNMWGLLALVAGYAAVWLGFSSAAASAQLLLTGADRSGGTASVANAGLFFFAGAYQFSRLKHACLSKCRHPLLFLMEHWKPGTPAAFRLGLRAGVYCLGCCWVLMLLGFVGGAMSMGWMGAATLFMTMEKLPELVARLTRPAGIGLLVAGSLELARAMNLI